MHMHMREERGGGVNPLLTQFPKCPTSPQITGPQPSQYHYINDAVCSYRAAERDTRQYTHTHTSTPTPKHAHSGNNLVDSIAFQAWGSVKLSKPEMCVCVFLCVGVCVSVCVGCWMTRIMVAGLMMWLLRPLLFCSAWEAWPHFHLCDTCL